LSEASGCSLCSNGAKSFAKPECSEFTLVRERLAAPGTRQPAGTTRASLLSQSERDCVLCADGPGHRLYASIAEKNFVLATAWEAGV
jgi:hypothetical protein